MVERKQAASCVKLLDLIKAAGVTFITGVPDSVFKELITQLEESELDHDYVLATREDNALALAVGAFLAGDQPLVFMESAGFGNVLDALTSLAIVGGIPLVLFIGWAGYKGRDVPHHNAIGVPLAILLEALDLPAFEVELDEEPTFIAEVIKKAVVRANKIERPTVVLGIPKDLREEK